MVSCCASPFSAMLGVLDKEDERAVCSIAINGMVLLSRVS